MCFVKLWITGLVVFDFTFLYKIAKAVIVIKHKGNIIKP